MSSVFAKKGFLVFVIIMFINATIDLGHKITIQNIIVKSFDGDMLVILTAIVNLLILMPYVLLFSISGFLNDKFSRTKIIRYAAMSAMALTFFITISYLLGWFYISFFMTILFAVQSAIYAPAKYGLIKKMVGAENLGAANGIVQAVTIIAILLSSLAFSIVFENLVSVGGDVSEIMESIWIIGIVLFICSTLETYFAFKIPFYEASSPNVVLDKAKYIKFGYLRENLNFILGARNIFLCTLGLGTFWAVAQLVIATFPAHFKSVSGSDNVIIIQAILAVSAIGLAVGSSVAGSYCKKHIELGIVPFGAIGLFIALLMLASSSTAFGMGFASFLFGFSGGIFIVPLDANIQFFTSEERMGRVLAGSNFIQNIFMVTFLILAIIFVLFDIQTRQIFIITAFSLLICAFFAIKSLPHLFARILATPFFKFGYKVNVDGVENIPKQGGVLLLGNHISWIDWAVVQLASPRPVKFAMHKSFYDIWYLKWFLVFFRVIPIGAGVNKTAITRIRTLLENGEVVALFPEGHISYNGQIDEFQKGFELAVQDSGAKIVPFYIRGLWGSSFSRAQRYYKKITSIDGKRSIRVTFGEQMDSNSKAYEVKEKVMELSFFSWGKYIDTLEPVQFGWLKQAKSNLFKRSIVDSTGVDMNNLKVITAVLIFLSKFKKSFSNEENIGVILPSSAMGSIINLVLFIKSKIPANLNYTLSDKILNQCVQKANIKTIITSKQFVQKLVARGFDLEKSIGDKLVYLEDIATTITKKNKIFAMLKAIFLPRFMIDIIYFTNSKIDDNATILFSSGSEDSPKGVVLTHKNIMANIKQIAGLLNTIEDEVILASLPIFHSFGLTVTTYLPLSEGIISAHVPDPTDAFSVGKIAAKYNATVMFGTSTFFRLYTKNKRLNPLMFRNIRYAIAGAEKLNHIVKKEFKIKFGITIYEGYGTTETTPVVSVNTPNVLEPEFFKELVFNKEGSVGLPLPGTIIKIVDPVTLKDLKRGEHGLILIGGHQVMPGYYEDEERTNECIVKIDDVRYYKSGDIGCLDEDGFLSITDRLSRFAKIGGEMISLGAVEIMIAEIFQDEIHFSCANLPDDKKGEKIVMLYSGELDKEEVSSRIRASKIVSIMQPSIFYKVEALPLLGTGKVDFKSTKELAKSLDIKI